jgi:hypothetical protein
VTGGKYIGALFERASLNGSGHAGSGSIEECSREKEDEIIAHF